MTVNGELTVIEGNDVRLTCDYIDVTPVGNTSAFKFGELSAVLDKVCIKKFCHR